ncbi:MAG TPA: hypothetical protein VNT52_10920 [Acidimicrobiales bacterium]|nr:hypothetical protein [Acidimicrobiales bacterium]
MTALTPYQPREVIDAFHKVDGRRWFVRDDEYGWWHLVEYAGKPGRLTCWCPDGQAHAEHPDTEPECSHRRAVIEHRSAEQTSSRPRAVVDASAFCD